MCGDVERDELGGGAIRSRVVIAAEAAYTVRKAGN
jgi:hypothetical protein